jgi:adenosylcobinamide-GDP ribazoletransferase
VALFTALRFLTVLPVPLGREADSKRLGRSLVFFPLIGLLLGLFLAGLDWILEHVLPVSVSSGIVLVVLVLITGANHLDGLIDTCDGMVAGRTPEQRREIMRDSRVGAFGVAGACCLLLLMYVSLANLAQSSRFWALALMPVLGRWAVVCAIWAFPYARPEGLGRAFKDQTRWWMVALATVVALAVSVVTLRLTGLAAMLAVGVVTLLLCLIFKHKFAGLTGDSYGAIVVTGELVSLIVVIAEPSWSW